MLTGLLLPFRFDPALLKADLARVQPEEWTAHYNERDYGGEWRGAALRSVTGATGHIVVEGPGARPFVDTPLLERCPYFREVLSAFPCPLKSVRLLSLAPRSFIREHSDNALGYEEGEIRIHVPIETNPGVEFYVCGKRLLLEEGGCYYVNVNLPHRVNNRGSSARIHLVIDAVVDEWVRELFGRGQSEGWHIPFPLPSAGVDEFRRALLRDDGLREALGSITDPRQFGEAAVKLGRELGFDLNEGDVDAALRARHAGMAGSAPPRSGWTPIRVDFRDGVPFAEWILTGERRFTEPFFEDSVRECQRLPLTAFLRCEWPLQPAAGDAGAINPSGFIFHMSRCGSTLVSQMLAALPGATVVAEADCIDQVIQAKLAFPELAGEEHVRWLRWIVAALGQRRAAGQRHYFIKLDAWHIHNLPLIRAAFPHTPWIFVHRHPLEVIVSHLRMPGLQALPGAMDPRALGFDAADITRFGREEWCARVLAGFLRSALASRDDPNALFIDYRQLPEAVSEPVATHFGLALTTADREVLRENARLDAKNPAVPFQADTQQKRTEAPPHVRQLVAELLEPLYRELNGGN